MIIIFWNAETFLAEAIASVAAQRFEEWELLLVDDGSTDRSSEIARSAATASPDRIRYLAHPGHVNRGMSASRNLGIRHARGRLISFLDADDALFPHALHEQVAVLDSHPEAAMVYGPIQWWYSWTGGPVDRDRDRVERLGVPAGALIDPPRLVPLFLRDKAAVPSGILVRREAVEGVGGFEDEFTGEYEDQVFCAKICLRYPVFAAGACWYRYRQHPDSAVSIGLRTGQTDAARLWFLHWLSSYLRRRRVRSMTVRAAVQMELWRLQRPRMFHLFLRGERMAARLQRALARWAPGR